MSRQIKLCHQRPFGQYAGNAWSAYQSVFDAKGFEVSDVELDVNTGFPNAELFAQYLASHIEEFTLLDWSQLSAQYVRNDVAKKAGGK